MTDIQPRISLSKGMLNIPRSEMATAVPVFVGYTAKDGSAGHLYEIGSFEEYLERLGTPDKTQLNQYFLYQTVRHYFDNGGGPCFVRSVGRYPAVLSKDPGITLGDERIFSEIVKEPAVTLIAMPDIELLGADVATRLVVWQTMLMACRSRQDIFFLLDPPSKPESARECLKKFVSDRSGFCAAYWPYLISDYKMDMDGEVNNFIRVPPSGAVAAAIQRTDREHGVWKAPANVALFNTVKPEYPPERADGLFDRNGTSINLIRSFPGRGVRVWGCRTLANASGSQWRYVQVRRLISYIEENLVEIRRFAVFEPNNEITWFKFKCLAGSWLRKLWHQGGLFGVEENQAFRILLGVGESMTITDMQQGKLIMKVSVAVLRPAEFIDIDLLFNLGESLMVSGESGFDGSMLR